MSNENIAAYENPAYPTVTTAAGALDAIIEDGAALGSDGFVAVPESPTEFTQTYNTAGTTVSAVTYAAPSVTSVAAATDAAGLASYGYTEAQANAIRTLANANKVDIAATNTKLAALAADALELRKLVTSIIDILQAADLAA